MSIKKPSREEWRKQYLATLNTEIKNNQMNAGANTIFKQTGTPSVPLDTRSITDKLADIEGLKVLLRGELMKITDGAEASSIISQLSNDEIRFAYEQFSGIERDLAQRFKTGVPAEAFLTFLNRYKERFTQTGGVEQSVEEVVAPLVTTLTQQAVRGRVSKPNATGDYVSALTTPIPPNLNVLKASEVRQLWKSIKEEIYRQLREETELTDAQIQRRQDLYTLIGNSSRPVAQGGTGGTKASDIIAWTENPANGQAWADLIDVMSAVGGKGIKGCGLSKFKSHKAIIPKPKGISKAEYAPFGRYKLDINKLDDDIFSIKKPCGANVPDLPTHRCSKRVSSCIKKIIGGSVPSYDDIIEMNEDERGFLHNLARKSRINDRIKIPAPNKDAQQKEMERFDILKGEILAGNDNKELVKEFKLRLLKLCKDGRIPRREVNEVLYDMMSVGL